MARRKWVPVATLVSRIERLVRLRTLPRVRLTFTGKKARKEDQRQLEPDKTDTLATHQQDVKSHSPLRDDITKETSAHAPPEILRENNRSENKSSEGQWSDESEENEPDKYTDNVGNSKRVSRRKRKSKAKSIKERRNSKWVAKLLNNVGSPLRDRVHVRKHRKAPPRAGKAEVHGMLRLSTELYASAWANVFVFLTPPDVCIKCATVNKALGFAVSRYFAQYCSWPRPRAFGAFQVFSLNANSHILGRILGMLSISDRVDASCTNRSFLHAADSLPLEFTSGAAVSRFISLISPNRVAARFKCTATINCDSISPMHATQLLLLMSDSTGHGDHDDDSDDNFDVFSSVSELSFSHFDRFCEEADMVQIVRALFADKISHNLKTLRLSHLGFVDLHFKYLSRLLYDGRFPALKTLDISWNRFSSRFMRDWMKSFTEDRLVHLRTLDITGVQMGTEDMTRFFSCLRHVPLIQFLRFSQNFCSVDTLDMLGAVIRGGYIQYLRELSASGISSTDHAVLKLVEALSIDKYSRQLETLDLSSNGLSGDESTRSLAYSLEQGLWPSIKLLNLSYTNISELGFRLLVQKLSGRRVCSLTEIYLAGNDLRGERIHAFVTAIQTGALRSVTVLNLSDNSLQPSDFELLSNSFVKGACPRLQKLVLSGNCARNEGVIRFRPFFFCSVARTLLHLDLSGNEISPHGLTYISETLIKSDCRQLHTLNISNNRNLHSVLPFQKLIRSGSCPSLVCLQVGYAQSECDGFAFVRSTKSHISVEELRRLKQLKFEGRLEEIEQANRNKAAREAARCKRQTRILREMYDNLENEADRALRRRKQVRKSSRLHIHEEIEQRKLQHYHERVRNRLMLALKSSDD